MAGKKAKMFYEVACASHGTPHMNDSHRSVKTGYRKHGTAQAGCPKCKKEKQHAKVEPVG